MTDEELTKKCIYKDGCKYKFTPYGIEYIQKFIAKGGTYQELGKIFKISANTIGFRCKEYGIGKDTSLYIKGRKKMYPFNEQYFHKINSPDKAYWLGFIAADGYVDSIKNYLQVTLQKQDSKHLEKMAKYFQTNKPITYSKATCNGQKFPKATLTLFSKQMIDDLYQLGIYNNKSLTYLPPSLEQVPEQYIRYWILGYFDGDGLLSIDIRNRYMMGFTGTKETLKYIQKYFNTNMALINEHSSNKNTYTFKYAEGKTHQFLSFLYQDDISKELALDRKYQKYLQILEIEKNKINKEE